MNFGLTEFGMTSNRVAELVVEKMELAIKRLSHYLTFPAISSELKHNEDVENLITVGDGQSVIIIIRQGG